MWIITILMLVITLAGLYIGQNSNFQLQNLSKNIVLNFSLIVLGVFTVLFVLYNIGYFPQSIAAPFMMGIYSLMGGLFLGYAFRIYTLRIQSGRILFQHRSFWVDHAPNFLSIMLILYGIYRTSILLDAPVTGIRLTSGISLICFGLFTWTLKTVPEFRVKGILFLDSLISWEYIASWNWVSETTLGIDYLRRTGKKRTDDLSLTQITTYIPEEDKKTVERILVDKTDEYSDIRRNLLLPDSDEPNGTP